jgi:hypothetical protein
MCYFSLHRWNKIEIKMARKKGIQNAISYVITCL